MAFLLSFIVVSFSACENDLEKIKEVSSQLDAIVETGKDVVIHYSDYGRLKSKLIAPVVKRYITNDPYLEFPEGLRLYFYDDKAEIDSRLSANYGIAYEKREEMIVRNDVVVINIKGEKLNTEELIWKQKEHKIVSDKFVKITTADEIIFGEGLEANEEFTDYTIKNIKGTIQLETDEVD